MQAMKDKIYFIIVWGLLLGRANFSAATIIENQGSADYSILCDNSNSIVIDNIEYYIQTDKSVYNLGENVNMLHRVTNLGDQDVTIRCYQVPEFNFLVQKSGNIVWARSPFFKQIFSDIELNINESIEKNFIWDMIDYNNNLIEPGIYDVIGVLYNTPTKVSVPIDVIPEPSSMVLFIAGVSVLLRK